MGGAFWRTAIIPSPARSSNKKKKKPMNESAVDLFPVKCGNWLNFVIVFPRNPLKTTFYLFIRYVSHKLVL